MRQFTEKEITGFARALQTYMRFANGQKSTVKTYAALIAKGLGQGLTMDEILNKENYSRAGRVLNKPTAEEYIDILINRGIAVHAIREDEGWDDAENIKMLATCVHDFCIEFLPKGGNYLTATALENTRKAILRHGVQTIMNESFIEFHKGEFEDDSKHTCYQYIIDLLQNAEEMGVGTYEDNLSERQLDRGALSDIDNWKEETVQDVKDEEITEEDKLEAEKKPGYSFNDENVELDAEPGLEPSQESMVIDGNSPFGEDYEDGDEEDNYISSSFNVTINPREYKAQMIHDLLIGLPLVQIEVLKNLVPDAETMQELIDGLAKGDYEKENETLEARNIHQYLNTELIRPFIECVRIEGIEMDDSIASRYDILLDDWDLRDARTRKKDKLKNLIYQYLKEDDDPDLQGAIEDIEKLYSKE